MIMAARSLYYPVPDVTSLDEVVDALTAAFSLCSEAEETIHSTYYDSFDWRLYQAGATLHESVSSGQHQLIWQNLYDEAPRESLRLTAPMPCFSWDYPPGLLHEMLRKNLEMRTLLPVVDLCHKVRMLRILDGEEKTVLRIHLEQNSARTPGRGEYSAMACRIRLLPVRGYHKALERVQQFLDDQLGVTGDVPGLLDSALAVIDRKPLDYSSKLDFSFDGQACAGDVARQIQLSLLDTIEVNIPGTRSDLDSEFLHDLRVAVRRVRSALSHIKQVFPDSEVEKYKERFAWIGSITGETRDLDVYLLGYADYRTALPKSFQDDLQPLHDFLVAHQAVAHKAMVRKINSPHFRGTLKEWRSFLTSPCSSLPEPANAARPVIKVARKRIYRVFQRVQQDGLVINAFSPPEALHALRKDCKKLRYLLEFFQSLFDRQQVQPLIKTLKVLLNNLGDYQDLEVQALKLRDFAHQMVNEGAVPADTLLAMGMLVDALLKRQEAARLAFADTFALFAKEENIGLYQQLLETTKKSAKRRSKTEVPA